VSADAPTLESVLLDEHLIDDASLRAARRVALRKHVALIEVVVDEHTVDEDKLADALARRLGETRIPLSQPVDEEALRELPHDLAAAHLCVPVHLDSSGERRVLKLAMANPLDVAAIEDIGHSSGCHIEAGAASLSEVRAAIERSYRSLITRMIPRHRAGGSAIDEAKPGDPPTQPLTLPDESSLELRLRALTDALVERGVVNTSDLDERVRKLVRGEDV
jgi:hypothetical protein